MSHNNRLPDHPAFNLLTTLLRAWGAGFVIAVLGTWWVLRKVLRLARFRRSPPPIDEGLVE
jgi:hypothetical protein